MLHIMCFGELLRDAVANPLPDTSPVAIAEPLQQCVDFRIPYI